MVPPRRIVGQSFPIEGRKLWQSRVKLDATAKQLTKRDTDVWEGALHRGIDLLQRPKFVFDSVNEIAAGIFLCSIPCGRRTFALAKQSLVALLEIHDKPFLVGLRIMNQAAEVSEAALAKPRINHVDCGSF